MSAAGELALLPAVELRRRIAAREVSPLEAVDACLARIARFDPALNAIPTLAPAAREEARTLEARLAAGEPPGLLCGLPVGIKDVTPVAGVRTTYGSPLFAEHVPAEDAVVVARLRAAGAIVLGKTNTPEFAAGGHTRNDVFGVTRNPWDPTRTAGGSTGGGAAALAAGFVALAEGTDLGGSLRIPAAFCGVVGLRPSPGLVPTRPSGWGWDTLQVTGPLGRTAEDAALMLQAVAGPDPGSPLAAPASGRDYARAVREAEWRGLRLAWCPDPAGLGVDPGVAAVCRAAVETAEREGASVQEVQLDLSFAIEAFRALRGVWMVVHHHPRLERLDEVGESVRGNIRSGLAVTAERLAAAERARDRVWEAVTAVLARHHALLAPCTAVPPFGAGLEWPERVGESRMESYVDWLAPTFVFSLSGLPAASAPCGLDADGLPVGLQIVAPPRGEEAALALAGLFQRARPIGLPALAGVEAAR